MQYTNFKTHKQTYLHKHIHTHNKIIYTHHILTAFLLHFPFCLPKPYQAQASEDQTKTACNRPDLEVLLLFANIEGDLEVNHKMF